ncbi:MAG: PIN domain-containing protein [Rhodospirillales bacterium]|nr:PIN domain-containing protein [Rhodospirillales bacterium]
MATMAADPIFIDTNVLVYASRPTAPHHIGARAALSRLEAEGCPLWISPQVLREYLAVVTRAQPAAGSLPMATAIADVRHFRASFEIAQEGRAVLDRLLELLGAHPGSGKQVHDTNLIATMLEHGVCRLLRFNPADFRRFSGIIDLEPLPAS